MGVKAKSHCVGVGKCGRPRNSDSHNPTLWLLLRWLAPEEERHCASVRRPRVKSRKGAPRVAVDSLLLCIRSFDGLL